MTVLAIKLGDPGDVLLTTPALQALHATIGQVDMLVRPHCVPILQRAPFVRRIVTTDQRAHLNPLEWHDNRRRREDIRALASLRRQQYEGMILMHHLTTWQGTARWVLLSSLLGIPLRIGLDNGRGRFLSHSVHDRGFGAMHEADYWSLLAVLYVDAVAGPGLLPPSALWLPASPDDVAWAETWHRTALGDAPFIAIHPGSGRYIEARRWPVGNYAALTKRIVQQGYRVVVVGTDVEQALAQQCGVGNVPGVYSLLGETSIGRLAAVLARSSGFVGNDSFPMHLAAAADVPLVAIFGPTNAAAWGPWPRSRTWFKVLVKRPWCQPCIYRGHQFGRRQGCLTRPCLTATTPAEVTQALWNVLAAKAQASTSGHSEADTRMR